MFIGHYGVALALKPAERRLSLFWLFLAVQLVDVFWGAFTLLGWEHTEITPGHTAGSPLNFISYPFTHSLVAAILWSGLAYGAGRLLPLAQGADRKRVALVLGVATLSHWFLDVIVHKPDLTLWGGDLKFGLGLWDHAVLELLLEIAMLAAGLIVYLKSTRPLSATGRFGMIIFSLILVGTLLSNAYGPLPPDMTAVGITVLLGYPAFALIAGWLDRKRAPLH
jgi:hypothetical protein